MRVSPVLACLLLLSPPSAVFHPCFVAAKEGESWKFEMELQGLTQGAGEKGTDGKLVIEVNPKWAPLGAARVKELLKDKAWDYAKIFRVVHGFIAQWGIPAKTRQSEYWKNNTIDDDPHLPEISNKKGTVTFATTGNKPHTRASQVFVNLDDNPQLDKMVGFVPFGKVVEGMEYLTRINDEYGEDPNQARIFQDGNQYLKDEFPRLSGIKKARLQGGKDEL